VNHRSGEQANPRVTMLLVVPVEELLAKGAAVLDAAETIREVRPILEGAKLAFGFAATGAAAPTGSGHR
jgi:hypothetical protein